MVHVAQLKKHKLLPDDLKEIFVKRTPVKTADGEPPVVSEKQKRYDEIRERFERKISSRLSEGFRRSLARGRRVQAVDLAWDEPVRSEQIPLMMWANGQLSLDGLTEQLKGLKLYDQFTSQDADGKDKLSLPLIANVTLNLIRAYNTRRLAAQSARFSNLWPYFKYEPRGTDDVARFRGDALSQRIEEMSDAFGYRHFWPQTWRHTFMYGDSLAFVRQGWTREQALRIKDLNIPDPTKIEEESYTTKEGVEFVASHPSRRFWDTSAPLAAINHDSGPRFLGYWDIVRHGTLKEAGFYNLDSVSCTQDFSTLVSQNKLFFDYYFDPKILQFPNLAFNTDPTEANDRRNMIGLYSDGDDDKGVLVAQYFEKLNPAEEKISTLDMDVWFRFTVAGDNTIIGAEVLPSTPAVYCGYNCNDDREENASLAQEIMPFQAGISNLLRNLETALEDAALRIWAIDEDAFDNKTKDYIRKNLKNRAIYKEPQPFFFSGSKYRQLGLNTPQQAIQIIQANLQQQVATIIQSIGEYLSLCDRVVILSQNEVGQAIQRTTSAREVQEISNTTGSIQSFVSDSIDEQRAAVKRLLYESLVSCSRSQVKVAVTSRYSEQTIKDAGFTLSETHIVDGKPVPLKVTCLGDVKSLVYEYYFGSRDGAERAINIEGAKVLGQLLGQFAQSEVIMKRLGNKRLFGIVDEMVRLSGAAIDFKLSDGEPEDGGTDQPDAFSTGGAPANDQEERIATLEATLAKLLQQIGGQGQPPAPPPM